MKRNNSLFEEAQWIAAEGISPDVVPVFIRSFTTSGTIRSVKMRITSKGVYEAFLNGKRIGNFIMAPGWTSYEKRLQVQEYDVTAFCGKRNDIAILLGKGWYASPMPGWIDSEEKKKRSARKPQLLAELVIDYEDGHREMLPTDTSWKWTESAVRFSEIYDGENYDARIMGVCSQNTGKSISGERDAGKREYWPVRPVGRDYAALIPQEGEEVREQERIAAKTVFQTPSGETVVDFGQEVTGYPEFTVDAREGEHVTIFHGEVLDREGNFYNANYRSAKACIDYICREGRQTWHPHLTFFGFRYLKVTAFPGKLLPEQFTAISVYSSMQRTGFAVTGHPKLNRLLSNIFWGQRDNFLDVPTDCPQRDERLGWTGDAQVFVKAASLNFDAEKFFTKWLGDLAADQRPDGSVGSVIPDILPADLPSAAWGDAAVICPWQIYQTYGNAEILRRQWCSMKAWVDYIGYVTTTQFLWTGGTHFGDWLGLDAPQGSYKGSSREDLIASAFYAHAVSLLVKAGEVLGKDMSSYQILYERIRETFREHFPDYKTQTEHVLAIRFNLCKNPQEEADELADMIRKDGKRMCTGFVGTPYLLHVLSEYGYSDLAWSLLLREEYPSWLYSVNKGATTVWEHWDGIMEDGSFWSTDMNSFNHYAYGSVIDWIYEKAAGIRHAEDAPGFSEVIVEPEPDARIGHLDVMLKTRSGDIRSSWSYTDGGIRYEIETQMPALIRISGEERKVLPGKYLFWGKEASVGCKK